MSEFIVCLIKYTAIFACMLYAYTKLLRIKLKAWDLFDILLFVVLSAGLHFVTVYVKILVPVGLLIFGVAFLFVRFRKTFYETLTVGTIALGISIVLMLPASIVGLLVDIALELIEVETVITIIYSLIVSIVQIMGTFLLFKIKRLQSGINPKSKNATFDIILYIGVICIFTMIMLYADEVKYYLFKVVLLVIALSSLLLIVWWRRHITYSYREAVKEQNVNLMEDTIDELKSSFAEKELKLAVYDKLIHYLNKAVRDCVRLAERVALQTGSADACDLWDFVQDISNELNLSNEKCSLQNIPQTGVGIIDMPIIQLFAVAERKSLTVSANISTDVEGWFTESNLRKNDVHILLSYLCDNAMISALGSPGANVRVELGATANKKPLIRIYDSGEQFDEEVLEKLGLEQVTTRAGDGGSGIGLFTVFEILAKYGASFTLDEAPESFGFAKFIEIAFDGRRSVLVRTFRESVVEALAERKGISVEFIDLYEDTLRDGTNG